MWGFLDQFGTAVPLRGHITQILGSLSPKWVCSLTFLLNNTPKKDEGTEELLYYTPTLPKIVFVFYFAILLREIIFK